MLVFVVIVVLAILCFFALRRDSKHRSTEAIQKTPSQPTSPKIYRYCTECYKPCRPKDMVCRECGHVLRPDLLARYEATEKNIRYCSNCYKPCEPGTIICNECGYVLRPELFKAEK